jgi:protein ImuA
MPGVGFPRWEVELLKVRNGEPGKWIIEWSPNGIKYISGQNSSSKMYVRKTA